MVLRDMPGPSAESRSRVLAAAKELGFRPHSSARLLRQNRTRMLGVAFILGNPFQARVVERMFGAAAARGFALTLAPVTHERPVDVVVSELIEERVEALIAFNPDPDSPAVREALRRMPTAWLGEWTDEPDADNIHVDEVDGLRRAVEHLVGLGHRDIVYVGGRDGSVGRTRADAYTTAMASAGLAGHAEIIPSGFDEEDGAAAARVLAARDIRPTAVICCGDQCAVGLLAVFSQAHIAVPADISVVGFDDSTLASLSYHQLTSVRQGVDATVDAALDAVIDRIEGGTGPRRVIATEAALIVRATTGPARSQPSSPTATVAAT
jgi:DNA-binding LacI/PurR family transcriptional regulator